MTATRQRWLAAARAAWLVLLAALLLRVLVHNRSAIVELAQVERPLLLAVALAAAFAQLWLNAMFWRRGLAAAGQQVEVRTILRATARSVPARYVPGSVWYAASRVALLRARGVRLGALTVTAVLEAVLTVLVSLALGGVLLAGAGASPGRELFSVAWVLPLALLIAPPVLNRLLAWAARRRGVGAPRLTWQDQATLIGWMAVFWALSAIAFTCYLFAFDVALVSPVVVAGAFLVAWAIGYLTPIAPQGAGAFEVALVAILVGAAGAAGTALGQPLGALALLIAGFRAVVGLRDALAFAWGAAAAPADVTPVAPAPRS